MIPSTSVLVRVNDSSTSASRFAPSPLTSTDLISSQADLRLPRCGASPPFPQRWVLCCCYRSTRCHPNRSLCFTSNSVSPAPWLLQNKSRAALFLLIKFSWFKIAWPVMAGFYFIPARARLVSLWYHLWFCEACLLRSALWGISLAVLYPTSGVHWSF